MEAIEGEMKFPVELQYGDFGCADPAVEERTGEKKYNVKIMMWITKDTAAEVYLKYADMIKGIPFIYIH